MLRSNRQRQTALAVFAFGAAMSGCSSENMSEEVNLAEDRSALVNVISIPLPVGANPSDLAMAASVGLNVNDGANVFELGSNDRAMVWNQGIGLGDTTVGTNIGTFSSVGTILSRPLVQLRVGAFVSGSVSQGVPTPISRQSSTSITGFSQIGVPFTADTTWTRSITWPTTFNATPNLEPGQPPATVVLAPGAYHNVDVKTGRTLRLTAGEYFMDSFIVNSGAGLDIDASAGPVFVHILASGFTFRGTMAAGVNTPGMPVPSLTVMTTGPAIITNPFTGVVVAPNSNVNLGNSQSFVFRGAFFGRTVTLFEHGILRHYRDPYSFRGFGPSNGTPFIGDRVSVTGGGIRVIGGTKTDEGHQNEADAVVSRNGSNSVVTVTYNDVTPSPAIVFTDPQPRPPGRPLLDPRNGAGRELHPGTSLMGWSYSVDGGRTFNYGGRVAPPPGWSIIWGDPATAKLDMDDPNVYYSQISGTTAVFNAAAPSGAIVNSSPIAALNGFCIARSTNRGVTFPAVACTNDVFQDGNGLAVARGANGDREVYVGGHLMRIFRMNGETMTFAANNPLPPPFASASGHPRMKVNNGTLYIAALSGSSLVLNRLNAAASASAWMGEVPIATDVSSASVALGGGVFPAQGDRFSFDFGTIAGGGTRLRAMYMANDPAGGIGLKTVQCNTDLTGCQTLGWSTLGQAGDEFQPNLRFDSGRWVGMWKQRDASPGNTIAYSAGQLDLVNGAAVLTQRTLSFGVEPCFHGAASFARWGDYDHMASFGNGQFFAVYTVNGPGCRFRGDFTADQHIGGSVFMF
jgi:hypothetical protein